MSFARYTEEGMQQYESLLGLQAKQLQLLDQINAQQANRTFELLERAIKLRRMADEGSTMGSTVGILSEIALRDDPDDPLGFAKNDPSLVLETS